MFTERAGLFSWHLWHPWWIIIESKAISVLILYWNALPAEFLSFWLNGCRQFWWSVTLGRQHRLPLRTFLQDPLCLCVCRMCCVKMLVRATIKAVLSILTGVYRLAGITQGQAWKWLWSADLWILNTLDWEPKDCQLSTLGFCLHPFFFFFLQCFVIPHMMSDAGVAGMIKYKDFL